MSYLENEVIWTIGLAATIGLIISTALIILSNKYKRKEDED